MLGELGQRDAQKRDPGHRMLAPADRVGLGGMVVNAYPFRDEVEFAKGADSVAAALARGDIALAECFGRAIDAL